MADFKFIMFFVWVAAMMLACWSVEVARMFARRVGKEAQRRENQEARGGEQWPHVAVILPIKGVDTDTEANVQALLAQDYPVFRLLFAVESADDPVVDLLRQLAGQIGSKAVRIETVVAGLATTRGQKIQNQLAAVAQTTSDEEVLVFMDADARPKPEWLRELVKPLRDPQVGATTGFRFYVPEKRQASLPDAMASVINAAVAALLGPGWRNIAWGGSMAIRRADFFAFGVQDAWQRALSDDYVLSWCVKNRAKRQIRFVQACLVESAADFDWPAFWEFAARQYRITRICAPGVWLAAIGAASLYLVGLAYTLVFWIQSMVASDGGTDRYRLALLFVALYLANVIRGWFLLQGGIVALPEEAAKLRQIGFWYTWGYPLSLGVNLVALAKSAVGRTIVWRGVTYQMHNRLGTDVERPDAPGLVESGRPVEQPEEIGRKSPNNVQSAEPMAGATSR